MTVDVLTSPMTNFLVAGTIAGTAVVAGEVVLNGWLLLPEWQQSLERLSLPEPPPATVLAGFIKLFALGFVLVWLYDTLSLRYGVGTKAALLSGALVAGLVWIWVMLGMLLAGYVTWTIAWVTMVWGAVELPLAALLGARWRQPTLTVSRTSNRRP